MATVATKLMAAFRKRGVLLLAISALTALLSAKGGPYPFGFWDGPS